MPGFESVLRYLFFMIPLLFVRNSNGLRGIVGTTGFWCARYGFGSQHLPIYIYMFFTSILRFWVLLDCFFSTPIGISISHRFLVVASLNKKLTFAGTVFFHHYSFQYPMIFLFSPIVFSGKLIWRMQRQFIWSTVKYSQAPKGPFYEKCQFFETKK